MKTTTTFPALLEAFFTDRLMRQKCASPHTVAAYRDTFRQLLRFAQERLERQPSALRLEDIDAVFVGAFLDHLEEANGICARSRNARLAAIRSFFAYVAYEEPGHAALTQRVLAIPNKRHDRALIDYLIADEVTALLAAPDLSTWSGRRDCTLLSLDVEAGLRVSELLGLQCQDIVLGPGAHVHCHGKGRKERCTPMTKPLAKSLTKWVKERNGSPTDPLFPNARGGFLSSDGVEYILAKHVATATMTCPTLGKKRVSPHVLRHTAAMALLERGVDPSVIALWLGHESPETTQIYLDASMAMKEEALKKGTPFGAPTGRFRADDDLMAFLKSL
jgi:site-specific recombinase XerD